MTTHSKFSPSAASRWIKCPGSANVRPEFVKEASPAMLEGTVAHIIAEAYLRAAIHERISGPIQEIEDKVLGAVVEETLYGGNLEMREAAHQYKNYVHQLVYDFSLASPAYIEETLDTSAVIGQPEQRGTPDAIVINQTGGGKVDIHVIDYKYGSGFKVHAKDNKQLMIYGMAMADKLNLYYGPYPGGGVDYCRITGHIVQPRMDNWTSTCEYEPYELEDLEEELHAASYDANSDNPTYTAGAEQCRWCPLSGSCQAQANYVFDSVKEHPTDSSAIMTAKEIASAYARTGVVEGWLKAVKTTAKSRILSGEKLPGYKLVLGRKGNRKWLDEEVVSSMLKKMRIRSDIVYSKKLLSPTALAKVKDSIGKGRWNKLEPLICRAEGTPMVASIEDERQEVNLPSAENDFDNLDQRH